MPGRRRIEVFSSGSVECENAISLIRSVGGDNCELTVHDMADPAVAQRAAKMGIRAVPAMVVDGRLARCCMGRGPDEVCLRAAGIGKPLP